MKILFVIGQLNMSEPFGIMCLMAIAKKNNYDFKLGVNQLENVLAKALDYKPDVVAVSAMSCEFNKLLKLSQDIKKHIETSVIFGGVHVTACQENIFVDGIDAICIGEGDNAFLDFLRKIELKEEIKDIPNIITKKDTTVKIGNLIENLDVLPFPEREMIYEDYDSFKNFGFRSFMTTRGCPYPCTYCYNLQYQQLYKDKGKYIRRRSVDNIIEEIKLVKSRYRMDIIRFGDDSFVLQHNEWLEDFSHKFKKEINIPFYCQVRADGLTDPIVKLLKQAGWHSVSMSIEAGNEKIRREILHRNVSNEKIKKAVEICHKYGIKVYSAIMIALPDTTLQNDIESLDFAIECKTDMTPFLIFMPLPGTLSANKCIEKGYWDGNFDSVYSNLSGLSRLTCFTEKEKLIQQNITFLGPFAVRFPFLRNLIVNKLIYWKPNKIFSALQFLLLGYLWAFKIVPSKYTLSDLITNFKKVYTWWSKTMGENEQFLFKKKM